MATRENYQIIPEVSSISGNDSIFTLKQNSTIGVSTGELMNKGNLLRNYLTRATGYDLPLSVGTKCDICLILEGSSDNCESYEILINENQCLLKSAYPEGLARAIQTFRQLLPQEIFSDKLQNDKEWTIKGCEIEDFPRFPWRGMHLDVCRHFINKDEILRFIDLLALYKFNRFHFHLTEDQGWRIEIKKYPLLTEIGSRRDSTLIGHGMDKPKRYDDCEHGGFYTQEEIREIVTYASQRDITIIPEIDMPGHMQAAISAYPRLGCTDMTLKPLCHWGISQHILNVEDSTVDFMKDVLDEVMSLFPGPYVHIGGDEAPKYEWEEQRIAQDRMVDLGLKNEEELQSWFIGQMVRHIENRGKKAIGWDEVLEGGLAEGTIVMSWRGEEGGKEAAALGHKVIMTPQSHVYFDHYQGPKEQEPLAIGGFTPLEKVYHYEPVPEDMPVEQQNLVLGSQGQLWTEYMKDFRQVEYMMFPRACALSENLWIQKERKEFSRFSKRLEIHKGILDRLNVQYHKEPSKGTLPE
jgi:hexosaminidase